jgi:Rrf2 family transcriptional regulator, iron-sulfur cluster assembly transcription factor
MFIYGKTSAHAIAVMSFLAADPARRAGSAEIAQARGIPQPITAKLLTRLATAGLVSGQPGPGGGYKLARPAESIRLMDIAVLFEQIDAPAHCPFGHDWCGKGDPCPLHDQILDLQASGRRFLEETRLSVFALETATCKPVLAAPLA